MVRYNNVLYMIWYIVWKDIKNTSTWANTLYEELINPNDLDTCAYHNSYHHPTHGRYNNGLGKHERFVPNFWPRVYSMNGGLLYLLCKLNKHALMALVEIGATMKILSFGSKIMILNNNVVVVKDGFTNSLYAIKDRIWKHPWPLHL